MRLSLGLLAAFSATSVMASPVTYSCQLTTDAHFTEFGVVDQIVIDREKRTLELRDASTMGTQTEVNWVFVDRGTPDDAITWYVKGDSDAMSGTRFGIPYILYRQGTHFGLSWADGLPFVYHEWDCQG